jgi:glycosyltransferase involved in cell wall biosynthesis
MASLMNPVVSVCIPAFHQAEFLRKTLNSIQNQDFTDYELVISDDSLDNSVQDLLGEFEFSGRLRYSKNSIPLGSPANWNKAVDLSNGALIKIMHHDDWFSSSSSLREYVELIGQDPKIGFAFSGVNTQSQRSNTSRHQFASTKDVSALKLNSMPLMLRNCIGSPSSTIVRRECFKSYRENLQWLVDVFQYAEILENTQFAFTSRALIYSTTDAEHQITNSCQNNPSLLIYEYLYFFDCINDLDHVNCSPYIDYLNELILKYKIKQEHEIRATGYQGVIPHEILEVLGFSDVLKQWKLLKLRFRRKVDELLLNLT